MKTSTILLPVSTQPINEGAQNFINKFGFKAGVKLNGVVAPHILVQIIKSINKTFSKKELENVMILVSTDVRPGAEGSCGAVRVEEGVIVTLNIAKEAKGTQLVHVVNHELHHLTQYLLGTTWNLDQGWVWKGAAINATSWANDPGEMDAEINAYRITLEMLDGAQKSEYIKKYKRTMRMYTKDLAKWEKKNLK